jgi:hypothetical protein
MSTAIAEIIRDAERLAWKESLPEWLFDLAGHWATTKSTVVTLNYDTLVELSGLERNAKACSSYTSALVSMSQRSGTVRVSRSGGPPSFVLVKLHGSINWFYSGVDTFAGDPVYYQDVDLDLKDATRRSDGLVPMIIPPITDKSFAFQNTTAKSQWASASNYAGEAARIFVLGYSLPATDLTVRFWLSEAKGKEIIVIDANDRVRSHFRSMLGDGFRYNFDFVGTPDCIPSFVKSVAS